LPYWTEEDEEYTQQNFEGWGRKRARKGISAARCARVSYLNHEGVRDIDRDLELAEKLVRSRHWSALEHPATAQPGQHGNFVGWKSYRKEFPGESGEASSC
jgi:hypothetical protein